MSHKRAKAAVIDALLSQGGFGSRPARPVPPQEITFSQSEEIAEHHDEVKRRLIAGNQNSKKNLTPVAGERQDIGIIQIIHRNVPVIDTLDVLLELDLSHHHRVFIPTHLLTIWPLHDRQLAGIPDVTDIMESLRTEGQEEPCKVRLNRNTKTVEIVAGFRRFQAISNINNMYLLADLYDDHQLNDKNAWIEMTRENNLDRKKPIPIFAQVESDRRALESGVFKNLSELSLAAGKAENWARQNRNLYEQLPEELRPFISIESLSSLSASMYRKLGRIFNINNEIKTQRIQKVIEQAEILFADKSKFPMNALERLFEVTANNRIRDFSTRYIRVRRDHNGNVNIALPSSVSEQQLKSIIRLLDEKIQSVINPEKK
ncbi:MAG: ParB N-terminal domain-containing protein [Pseudomonadota bacterium]